MYTSYTNVNVRVERRIVPGVIGAALPTIESRFENAGHGSAGAAAVRGPIARGGAGRVARTTNRAGAPRSAQQSGRFARIEADPVGDLTRGRRAALLVLVAVTVLLLCTMGFKLVASPYGNLPTEIVVVAQGDTLWSICERHPVAGMSTRECVEWTKALNGLDSPCLVPGQLIEVASVAPADATPDTTSIATSPTSRAMASDRLGEGAL